MATQRLRSRIATTSRAAWMQVSGWAHLSNWHFTRHLHPEWRNLDALLAHLATRSAPVLTGTPCGNVNPAAVMSTSETLASPLFGGSEGNLGTIYRQLFPSEATQLGVDADRICQGQFRYLGQDFAFPDRVDWHREPVSGSRWPRHYIGKMERWFWETPFADPLPTWELNRHQHLVTLAQAYRVTGDLRYPATAADHVSTWIADNPPAIGINWFSALEVAIRLIAWALAFHMLRDADIFITRIGKDFIRSLYHQTAFLRQHLTLDWPVPNNHLIGEATALVVVGALFPQFREASAWVETGMRILEAEVVMQTHPDGINKEQATGYHRFVLDLLLLVVLLGRSGIAPRSSDMEIALERMLTYALYAQNPCGHLSPLGDSGEGWGLRLSDHAEHLDVRPWLAVGAVLYGRSDFKFAAQQGWESSRVSEEVPSRGGFPAEAFWVLGPAGLTAFEALESRMPARRNVAFPQGGHVILRDRWHAQTDFLIIRSGPFGLGGEGACAHAHCDLLSIILWIAGVPILVDAGTHTYHGPWRDGFRLTAAHNTLRIDDQDQAVPAGDFAWQHVPEATLAYYNDRAVKGVLTLNGVTVMRHIRHPLPGLWRVSDSVIGRGLHKVDWAFHFAPELRLRQGRMPGRWVIEATSPTIRDHRPFVQVVPPIEVETRSQRGWVSRHYSDKELVPLLVGEWSGEISGQGRRFDWEFRKVGEPAVTATPAVFSATACSNHPKEENL